MAVAHKPNTSPHSTARCVESIQSSRMGVCYEALVDIETDQTIGYEALARFYDADARLIDNGVMFSVLHENPALFYAAELSLKEYQIVAAPLTDWLFVNLDPHAYFVYDMEEGSHPMHELFRRRDGNLVVELTENRSLSDAQLRLRLANTLIAEGHAVAIDDIGHPRSLLSIDLLNRVQYFKFDQGYLRQLDQQRPRELTMALLNYARSQKIPTVIEGIESYEQLSQARSLGFNIAQGYYFGNRAINVTA